MNGLFIIGRLTGEYEVKDIGRDRSAGNFSIAVDDGYGDNKHTSFYEVSIFGKSVEQHKQYIGKGSKVGISGSIKQERWEGQDGTKRSKVKIIASRLDYLDAKKQESSSKSSFDTVSDDDIPF